MITPEHLKNDREKYTRRGYDEILPHKKEAEAFASASR
jgi:hypothetical protein